MKRAAGGRVVWLPPWPFCNLLICLDEKTNQSIKFELMRHRVTSHVHQVHVFTMAPRHGDVDKPIVLTIHPKWVCVTSKLV
jgi:hypothetical protein